MNRNKIQLIERLRKILMSSKIYSYSTLNSDQNEIRLLELAPGDPNDDLSASLTTASLDSSPSYEALSYVWGDRAMPGSMNVKSSSFAITRNLEAALRRMRMPTHTRTLWVDAICINQEDLPERQTQVQLMRRIYSQSSRVLIWLGEEEVGDQKLFDFLISLSGGAYAFTRDCVNRADDEYQEGDCETPMRQAGRLINRPWWFRAWTLQEIACGKECRLHSGSLVISWQQLCQAYDQLRASRIHASTQANHCKLCSFCTSGLNAYVLHVGAIAAQKNAIEQERPADLLECVVRNRSRRATDPRDKVYAFLGLSAKFHADLVIPSYEKTIAEVYSDFAFQTLKMDGPRILLHAGDCEKSEYQLASWVPDWTASRPTSYGDIMAVTRQLRYELFKACGGEQASALRFTNIPPGVLSFEGILVDSVLHVGQIHPWAEWCPDSSVLTQWQNLAQLRRDPGRPYATHQITFKEAFWRTILCDTVIMGQFRGSKHSRATPEHEDYFWKGWNLMVDSEEVAEEEVAEAEASEKVEQASSSIFVPAKVSNSSSVGECIWESPSVVQVLGSIPVAVLGRRFFVTKTGLIGIGPSNVQEGDEIWIIARCRVPIIVRKCGTEEVRMIADDKRYPLYTLVGDSYVHGVMDGESTSHWERDKSFLMLQ